jgi:hypothetical protein
VARSTPNERPVNRPDGAARSEIMSARNALAEPRETCEVVLAVKSNRPVQHAHDIERPIHLQALRDHERLSRPDPDSIPVAAPPGISSRIERRRCSRNLQNRNIGRQLSIQRQPEPRRLQIASDVLARGNLPQCVYPCVRATGHRNLDRSVNQAGNRLFQDPLDGSIAALALRARELRAVVRENQLQPGLDRFPRRLVNQLRR